MRRLAAAYRVSSGTVKLMVATGFAARLDEWLDRHQLRGAIRARALALPLRGLQHQGAELAIGKRSPEIVC